MPKRTFPIPVAKTQKKPAPPRPPPPEPVCVWLSVFSFVRIDGEAGYSSINAYTTESEAQKDADHYNAQRAGNPFIVLRCRIKEQFI